MLRSIGKQSAESVETRYKPEVVERDRTRRYALTYVRMHRRTDNWQT